MRRWRRLAVLALAGVAVAVSVTVLAARASHPDPKKAAAALVKSLHGEGATKIAHRNGALWVGISKNDEGRSHHRFWVYRWAGNEWTRVGDVAWTGWGDSRWPTAESLTGSRDPDFAVAGCGAADTICLSVVSDIGGRWHLVPFEYGDGRAIVVNGVPQGHFVLTQVDACGCAGGPTTSMYERYARGVFRPAYGPVKHPRCSKSDLEETAGVGSVATLQFDHFACAADWALAVGTGAGYDGPVVGLFNRQFGRPNSWRMISLDNGLSLPTASEIYDLPPVLLISLERKLGPSFTPILRATQLVVRLRNAHRSLWTAGLARAKDALWLVEVDRKPRRRFSAEVYRWGGSHWVAAGTIGNDDRLRAFSWGWFVALPGSPGVAFGWATSDWPNPTPAPPGKFVITNAGGRWHVANR